MRRRWELPENLRSLMARSVWPRMATVGSGRPLPRFAARKELSVLSGCNCRAVLAHDELVGNADVVERAVGGNSQNQRVVEAAGALHHRATAGTASQNRDAARFARRDVHFRRHLVRIADDDEMFTRFPKAQHLLAVAGFRGIQQHLVARQVFGGRGERQIE